MYVSSPNGTLFVHSECMRRGMSNKQSIQQDSLSQVLPSRPAHLRNLSSQSPPRSPPSLQCSSPGSSRYRLPLPRGSSPPVVPPARFHRSPSVSARSPASRFHSHSRDWSHRRTSWRPRRGASRSETSLQQRRPTDACWSSGPPSASAPRSTEPRTPS